MLSEISRVSVYAYVCTYNLKANLTSERKGYELIRCVGMEDLALRLLRNILSKNVGEKV